jgi:drug/metabolite transporter (DMT)-like permease
MVTSRKYSQREYATMALAVERPILLIKKLAGILLLLFGLLLTALGLSNDSTGLTTIGILLLAAGAVLLVLKIIRRNQNRPL